MGRRLGAIDGGLGWAAKEGRREGVGGRAEEMVVVGRQLLADRRGRRLALARALLLLLLLGGDLQLGHVKRILALLSVGPRARGEIGGVRGPELEHDRPRRRRQWADSGRTIWTKLKLGQVDEIAGGS